MHTVQILTHFVENHQIWAYLIIFFGLVFEGEVVVITAGVLSYLGALDFWVSLIFILAGGITKAFGCYYLGTLLAKRYNDSKFLKYLRKRVLYFMPRFEERPFWSIFISKFINGVNYWIAIFSGYVKISFKTYLKAEIFSTVIWAPLLLSLGYFFSQTALSYSKEINRFSLAIFILLVVFLLFDKLVAAFFRVFEYLKNGGGGNGNVGNNNEHKQ